MKDGHSFFTSEMPRSISEYSCSIRSFLLVYYTALKLSGSDVLRDHGHVITTLCSPGLLDQAVAQFTRVRLIIASIVVYPT